MTKKHLDALASVFVCTLRQATVSGHLDTWTDIRDRIAGVCDQFNIGFDRNRFLAACRGDKT